MSFISWNCCGLGNPQAAQFLKELVTQKKPNFLFLCETKCGKNRIEWLKGYLGFEGMLCVEPQGRSGGVAFLWRWHKECHVLGYSHNHIDVEITKEAEGGWRFTGIYGEPNRNHCHVTWELLRQLSRASSLPWCVMGSLNSILSVND